MIPARCSPRSRSTSVIGMRASRPIGTALILPSLTQRRTVSGCKPRRLATSPERNKRVFSVLITRIVYNKYVNPSTVVHPALHVRGITGNGYFPLDQFIAGWFFLGLTGLALFGFLVKS